MPTFPKLQISNFKFQIVKSKTFFYSKELLKIGNWKLEIRNSSQGFTLIELLIAIAIIGIVFGVVVSSTAQIQKSSRDAKRESDLRNIQSALQQFYADQNYFPSITNIDTLTSLTTGSDTTGPVITPSKTYLQMVPKDPETGSKYCYVAYRSAISTGNTSDCNNSSANKCYFYRIFTKIENSRVPAFSQSYCSVNSYNYELTPN